MSENPKKVMDIINIDEENLYNLLKELGNFNEIFKKKCDLYIKSHKKARLQPLSRKCIFGKTKVKRSN